VVLVALLAWAVMVFADKRGIFVRHALPPDDAIARTPLTEAILSAGEAAVLETDGARVQRLPSKDVTRRLAWTVGLIRLDGETLSEAVDEFNRYNRRKLEIHDPAIAKLRVSGTFKAREPESFVATLERSTEVRALSSRDSDPQVIRLVSVNTAR
jgi:transmembrane sensor